MMQESPNLLVFSGNANKRLAQNICKELGPCRYRIPATRPRPRQS